MKAIHKGTIYTIVETTGDYIVLRSDAWSTTMLHLGNRDLLINPTDAQIEMVERGEEIPRCQECDSLGCSCAEIGALLDEFHIPKGLVN